MMQTQKIKIIGEGIIGALTIGGTILLAPFLRGWDSRWGATAEEATREFPREALGRA